ncbi:spore germination protein [Bacillus mycoides]|uniref:spore germination protein n=1 Tax=Bacillus mycoides TaxID=1405 RepID=UPI002E0986D5|nr:spore germination protein [Bacillus mycoides]MEC5266934.1 spore germination protein [Bacillus mycoides]
MSLNEKTLETKTDKTIEKIQTSNLKELKNTLDNIFDISADLIEHPLQLKTNTNILLYYFEGLTDGVALKGNVVTPLLQEVNEDSQIFNSNIIATHTKIVYTWNEIKEGLLEGQCVLFMEGEKRSLLINTKGWAERAIQEPISEVTIKGSHDGFIENATKNIGLIRRYIPSTELKIKKMTIGERATSLVYLIYLGDVANEDVVQEIETRICKIKTDAVLSIGELSNFTKDQNWTPFPQAYLSERPDAISNHILDGKVAVLIDRSPGAMIVPMNLIGFFQTPDDYNIHWLIASFFRLLRFAGFIIAIFLPAIYIAIVSFHFEIIPLDLYTSIATSRVKVPFSPLLEAFIMEITLEMLREAGIRLPQPIGQTIGIVGGIVIGQAAVQAGLVSNVMVIIVSITAIASFIVSNYDLSSCIRLIRFPMMLLAYFYGVVGIVSGLMLLFAHFVSLTSYGSPYGLPIAPFRLQELKDSFVRFPISMITTRSSTGQPEQKKKKEGGSHGES